MLLIVAAAIFGIILSIVLFNLMGITWAVLFFIVYTIVTWLLIKKIRDKPL